MLKKTKNKLQEYIDAGKIHAVQGDCEHIPLRSDFVAGLVCTLTFDHFEDCELGASEFSRVLKQGGLCIFSTFNSRTLSEVQRRLHLPADKISFETEDMLPTLVHEVGHSAEEAEAIFSKNHIRLVAVKGCCYWHLLPLSPIGRRTIGFDVLFSRFKSLLKYAEIHVTRMVRD
ncbi:MAG: class I SAM-dependent methyltransferase [Aigarchaeota archaeon]|nr:class I SAM-dependent methyltransferase [Aigarchaeota archaeon]